LGKEKSRSFWSDCVTRRDLLLYLSQPKSCISPCLLRPPTACRQARTSLSTFYYWKERFEQGGYEALKKPKKPGPEKGIRVASEIQEKVVAMKEAHPEWGKRRIADELAKANSWVPVISPNAVRRILVENDRWPETEQRDKKTFNR
jgi:hypothetical protein